MTGERLVHWSSTPPGQCRRKDTGIDQGPPVQAGGGTIQWMAQADHPGNVTCKVCKRAIRRARKGVNRS